MYPSLLLAVAGVAIGLMAFASSSQAACTYPKAEQVFSQWGDEGNYELAPDGGFEAGGSGWGFSGGAALVAENEDSVPERLGRPELAQPALPGDGHQPEVLRRQTTPTFRFMVRNAGDDHTKLRVTVTYENGRDVKTRVIEFRSGEEWSPSEAMQLDTDGESEGVARISFTPREAGGEWLLDDVYIDPFARR